MADLYHIFIKPRPGVTVQEIEAKMNLAIHWYRYTTGHSYVVETTSDEAKWKERLIPMVKPGGHLFICKLDTTHYEGWMQKSFWVWFESRKGKEG